MADKLKTGDSFPTMSFDLVGGGSSTVPADLGDGYKIILFLPGSLVTLLPSAVSRL